MYPLDRTKWTFCVSSLNSLRQGEEVIGREVVWTPVSPKRPVVYLFPSRPGQSSPRPTSDVFTLHPRFHDGGSSTGSFCYVFLLGGPPSYGALRSVLSSQPTFMLTHKCLSARYRFRNRPPRSRRVTLRGFNDTCVTVSGRDRPRPVSVLCRVCPLTTVPPTESVPRGLSVLVIFCRQIDSRLDR